MNLEDIEDIYEDKDKLAEVLYEEERPTEVLRLIGGMGIESSFIAKSLNTQVDTVDNWLNSDSASEIEEQTDTIGVLKATTLFLLRRGILPPKAVALWLTTPQEELQDRAPIELSAHEAGQKKVIRASTSFTRPEPRR